MCTDWVASVSDLPVVLSAAGMYFVQLDINFVIPSGSGQGLVTNPIMLPLAVLGGRQLF